eukprot:2514599-Prymnesium_polylepis.2
MLSRVHSRAARWSKMPMLPVPPVAGSRRRSFLPARKPKIPRRSAAVRDEFNMMPGVHEHGANLACCVGSSASGRTVGDDDDE